MSDNLKAFPTQPRYTRDRKPRAKSGDLAPSPGSGIHLDHALICGVMDGMTRDERREFWTAHVDVLGQAMLGWGLAEPVVKAILADHFQKVRQSHEGQKREAEKAPYPIKFDCPPAIGTEIILSGKSAVLVDVQPIMRRSDGRPSFLLKWSVEGRLATSGLKSKGVHFVRPAVLE
jgi:hypothetical protein